MALNYRKATLDDLEILTETRIEVLRAANQLNADGTLGTRYEITRLWYVINIYSGNGYYRE